jgi:hypothetical protein
MERARKILDDAPYRVVDSGIENLVRELECLTALEYAGLDYPKAMRGCGSQLPA